MAAEKPNGQITTHRETTKRERSFDELVKEIATGSVSRRQSLRLMSGALFGGLLASIPGMAWAARPICSSGVRCRGQCCPEGTTCIKGAGGGCSCPTGQTRCDSGTCTDLFIDVNNCGECGNVCSVGQVCYSGCCVDPVPQHACLGCSPDEQPVCNHVGPCQYACFCLMTAEGTCACVQGGGCEHFQACDTTADCPFGYTCYSAPNNSCGHNVCVLNCSAEVLS